MCLKVHILQKLYLYSEKWKIIYFHLRWQELGICQQTALLLLSDSLFLSFTVLPNSTPVSSLVLWFLFFSLLYQIVAQWSKVASSFCCRLNRLVLDDRSKILTTSGEKRDAQPGRERRRPDRSIELHRGDAPLDRGEPCLTAPLDQVRISPSVSDWCQHLFAGMLVTLCGENTLRDWSQRLIWIILSFHIYFLN